MPSLIKVGIGIYQCIAMLGAKTTHVIHSLQGYPRELVRSSGTDVTLDGVLAILDKHYNNAKALDALNQELFQL